MPAVWQLTAYEAKGPVLKKVEDYGMMDLYRDVEMPLVYTLCDMEEAGIQVNAEELKGLWRTAFRAY